jgi:hypothetical protein
MSARESAATERALARVAAGESIRSAAEAELISRSTLQRAMRRRGEPGKPPVSGEKHHAYIDGRKSRQRPGKATP